MPITATVTLVTFLLNWSQWFPIMVISRSPDTYTLPVALLSMNSELGSNFQGIMALALPPHCPWPSCSWSRSAGDGRHGGRRGERMRAMLKTIDRREKLARGIDSRPCRRPSTGSRRCRPRAPKASCASAGCMTPAAGPASCCLEPTTGSCVSTCWAASRTGLRRTCCTREMA
jgi:hypothetical protein